MNTHPHKRISYTLFLKVVLEKCVINFQNSRIICYNFYVIVIVCFIHFNKNFVQMFNYSAFFCKLALNYSTNIKHFAIENKHLICFFHKKQNKNIPPYGNYK